MDTKDDLYIEILKFGRENLGKPISFNQLEIHLNEIGLDYNEFVAMYLFSGTYVDEKNPGGNQFQVPRDSESFYLNIGGYSELLDYIKLKEARSSSLRAMLIATLAIVVSILISLNFRPFQQKENSVMNSRRDNHTDEQDNVIGEGNANQKIREQIHDKQASNKPE